MEYIVVNTRLLERKERLLFFRADARSREGQRLPRSDAVHWIIDEREAEGENGV